MHLAKLLKAGGNVILLDEPTNDLDVDTLRALEDALLEFAGSVMVSYTKARAESIGVSCTVGMMERPERMLASVRGIAASLTTAATSSSRSRTISLQAGA